MKPCEIEGYCPFGFGTCVNDCTHPHGCTYDFEREENDIL